MRDFLLATYWFPPSVGAAARRMEALARYLPARGWRATVLTSGDPLESPEDPTPGTIIRVCDPLATLRAVIPDYDDTPADSDGSGFTLRQKLRAFTSGLIYPDRFVAWQVQAGWQVRRIRPSGTERFHRPHVVVASFPPASAAQLGARLATRWRVPLVLDYRDNWLGDGGYSPPTGMHLALHRRLQRHITGRARFIVAVSDAMADSLSSQLRVPRNRIVTIPNGFDAAQCPLPDRISTETGRSNHALTLAHVGMVIPRNRPDLFLTALKHAGQEKCRAWRNAGLRIRFVGNLSESTVQHGKYAGLLETTGLVSHETAWQETLKADALLLLVGDYVGRWGHNAKVFEYLWAGKPILCLEESPGSNDRRLLERLAPERSQFAPLGEPAAVVAALDGIIQRFGHGSSQVAMATAELKAYDRAALCEKWAAVLDRAAASDGEPRVV